MKAVLERKKAAAIVIAASRRWAATSAEALADLLRPELADGETLPDLELLQELFGRALERRWRRLEAADQAHCQAAELRGLWRRRLAAAISALYRRVVDLRTLLRGVFGTGPAGRLLGLAGKTSFDPVVLERQASRAVARLRDAALALPPAAYEPSAGDRQAWARPVDAAADALATARASASIAGKEVDAAAADRRRALEHFNEAFVPIAGWLEATYRAAGRAGHAAAVRPSRHRRGVLLADEDRRRVSMAAAAAEPVAAERKPDDGTLPADRDPDDGVHHHHRPGAVGAGRLAGRRVVLLPAGDHGDERADVLGGADADRPAVGEPAGRGDRGVDEAGVARVGDGAAAAGGGAGGGGRGGGVRARQVSA